jgi:hypothetical protein
VEGVRKTKGQDTEMTTYLCDGCVGTHVMSEIQWARRQGRLCCGRGKKDKGSRHQDDNLPVSVIMSCASA